MPGPQTSVWRSEVGANGSWRVIDDGCGIPTAEVDLVFKRHATSKLQTADDLERISTLGFRGEALAAISAVSKTILVMRARRSPRALNCVWREASRWGAEPWALHPAQA